MLPQDCVVIPRDKCGVNADKTLNCEFMKEYGTMAYRDKVGRVQTKA
jgi:hypothetical protein